MLSISANGVDMTRALAALVMQSSGERAMTAMEMLKAMKIDHIRFAAATETTSATSALVPSTSLEGSGVLMVFWRRTSARIVLDGCVARRLYRETPLVHICASEAHALGLSSACEHILLPRRLIYLGGLLSAIELATLPPTIPSPVAPMHRLQLLSRPDPEASVSVMDVRRFVDLRMKLLEGVSRMPRVFDRFIMRKMMDLSNDIPVADLVAQNLICVACATGGLLLEQYINAESALSSWLISENVQGSERNALLRGIGAPPDRDFYFMDRGLLSAISEFIVAKHLRSICERVAHSVEVLGVTHVHSAYLPIAQRIITRMKAVDEAARETFL
jgi:hypothetical protein